MSQYNEQETFWASAFTEDYINRNQGKELVEFKIHSFKKMLRSASNITSIIELGSNIGLNIEALNTINQDVDLCAVEINESASKILEKKGICTVINKAIADVELKKTFDLSFTSGVLIHINPEQLPEVYNKLFTLSNRYILINECYNPTPVTIAYRGNNNKFFKRDFAKEILDAYPTLKLIDYGFFYEHDPKLNVPSSGNWFLMEKSSSAEQ